MTSGLKLACTVLLAVGLGSCQRPPFISKPWTYPGVLPQYTQAPTTDPDLGNKIGEDSTTPAPTTAPTPALQGSIFNNQLNQVTSWPQDKLPFWFVNNQQIANHIGFQVKPQPQAPSQQRPPSAQSSSSSLNNRFGTGGRPFAPPTQSLWVLYYR